MKRFKDKKVPHPHPHPHPNNMVKLYAPVPQLLDGIWDIPYPIFTPPQRLHGCMKKMGYTGISQKNIATSRSTVFVVYGR